jgi:hypothetical protein
MAQYMTGERYLTMTQRSDNGEDPNNPIPQDRPAGRPGQPAFPGTVHPERRFRAPAERCELHVAALVS